jgi:hypothetical protein
MRVNLLKFLGSLLKNAPNLLLQACSHVTQKSSLTKLVIKRHLALLLLYFSTVQPHYIAGGVGQPQHACYN